MRFKVPKSEQEVDIPDELLQKYPETVLAVAASVQLAAFGAGGVDCIELQEWPRPSLSVLRVGHHLINGSWFRLIVPLLLFNFYLFVQS